MEYTGGDHPTIAAAFVAESEVDASVWIDAENAALRTPAKG
jgi:hypothetical protein